MSNKLKLKLKNCMNLSKYFPDKYAFNRKEKNELLEQLRKEMRDRFGL